MEISKHTFYKEEADNNALYHLRSGMYYCPKCKSEAHSIYTWSEQRSDVKFQCLCHDGNQVSRKVRGNHIKEITMTLSDKNVLSLYELSDQYFIPKGSKDGRPFNVVAIDRLSVNVETGAAYTYEHHIGEKRFVRIDWARVYPGVRANYDPEIIAQYCNKILELAGLSMVKVHTVYDEHEDTDFYVSGMAISCGEDVCIGSSLDVLSWVIDLISAPNLFIKYDGYTKKVTLRQSSKVLSFPETPMLRTTAFRRIQPRQVMDEGEYIDLMCSTLDIPASRQFKKLYRESPNAMALMSFFIDAGIKKPDNLRKLLCFMRLDQFYTRQEFQKFIKALVKDNGETAAANKLAGYYDKDGLVDAAHMYAQIKKAGIKCSLKGNIREIHDRLSEMIDNIKNENKPIKLTRAERKKEGRYGDYSVIAAEDTHRLQDIGKTMHICVGSYDTDALKKICTIYYIADSTGKYHACIELQKNKLCQAKGYCNAFLREDAARVVQEWVADKGINADHCQDYEYLSYNLLLKTA